MNKRERVSVCLCTYNGERFVKAQIESILPQLSESDEIIVSDDCSSDGTISVVESIGDERIKVLAHEQNVGYSKNFERGLRAVSGDYIFLCDQDDVWLPSKVAVTLDALRRSDFTVSDCITVDESLGVLDPSRFRQFHVKQGFLRHLVRTRYLGCCMAFRSDLLDAALPFPGRSDLVEHDTWLGAIAEAYFRVELIREPLVLYRRHEMNASEGGFRRQNGPVNMIVRRVYRLLALVYRRPRRTRSGFSVERMR